MVHRKMWNSASLKFCHGSVMFDQVAERNKNKKTSFKWDTSVNSSQYKRPPGTWSSVVRKMAYSPVRIANFGNSASDTMFWYSFRILPDRLKLIRLYPCGSLGPSISFSFGARAGHFAMTPQTPEWCSAHMCTWFWCHGDAVSMTQNAFFCAFITLR